MWNHESCPHLLEVEPLCWGLLGLGVMWCGVMGKQPLGVLLRAHQICSEPGVEPKPSKVKGWSTCQSLCFVKEMLNLGKSLLQPINECIVKALLANALQRKPSKVADKRQGQSSERLPGFNYGLEFNSSEFGGVSLPPQPISPRERPALRLLGRLRTACRDTRLLRGFLCTESLVDTRSLCRLLLAEAVKLEVKGAGMFLRLGSPGCREERTEG